MRNSSVGVTEEERNMVKINRDGNQAAKKPNAKCKNGARIA